MKKAISILLTLVVMLSLAAVAFADDPTYSITVNNPTAGETYKVYKIFDATYDLENNTVAYTISADNPWLPLLQTEVGQQFFQLIEIIGSSPVRYNVLPRAGLSPSSNADIIRNWMPAGAIPVASEVAVNNATPIVLDVTAAGPGYYYIDSSASAMVILTTTMPNATVNEKHGAPLVTKFVSSSSSDYHATCSASIGDTVYFKITLSNIAKLSNLVLHEYLPEGFTFGELVSVTGTATGEMDKNLMAPTPEDVAAGISAFYTLTESAVGADDIFTMSFPQATTNSMPEGASITVVYSATVNSDIEIGYTAGAETGKNENYAWLTYGNQSETTKASTEVHSMQLGIHKVDNSNNNLEDAKFILYKKVGAGEDVVTYYAIVDASNKLSSWTTVESSATPIVSGADGTTVFKGFRADRYYIREVQAPAGYNPLAEPLSVIVNDDGSLSGATLTIVGNSIRVVNNRGAMLPETGSTGTTIFITVGAIAMLLGGIFFVTNKRMKKEGFEA